MADAVAKTLESVGVERAVWVGHSIGGYVALEHYARRPDDLLGLALVCSRAAADDEKGRTARNAMIARIEQDGMKSVAPSMITKLFSQETVDRDPEAVRRVERIIEGTAPEGAAEAVRAMRDRKDHTDLLTRIAVPTLVVAGADDPIVPADEAKAMAATIEGSRLRTVEDAAHMPMIESSEAFAEILVEWVTEMSVTRGWQGLSTSRK
jgi:pimeloyl-ACP methyl ester carboxylesterase